MAGLWHCFNHIKNLYDWEAVGTRTPCPHLVALGRPQRFEALSRAKTPSRDADADGLSGLGQAALPRGGAATHEEHGAGVDEEPRAERRSPKHVVVSPLGKDEEREFTLKRAN